jgi:hypothetical protein
LNPLGPRVSADMKTWEEGEGRVRERGASALRGDSRVE